MNNLGEAAFDLGGSTTWREHTLPIDPDGDTIQLDITVANVGDNAMQSYVFVDFVKETKQSICIYSEVAEGNGNPGLTDGHAAILFSDTSTFPYTIATWGLWPDYDGIPNDLLHNYKDDGGDDPLSPEFKYFYCEPLSAVGKAKLDSLTIGVAAELSCTYTCASFASETFYAVTGTDVDADDLFGIETPREIGEHHSPEWWKPLSRRWSSAHDV